MDRDQSSPEPRPSRSGFAATSKASGASDGMRQLRKGNLTRSVDGTADMVAVKMLGELRRQGVSELLAQAAVLSCVVSRAEQEIDRLVLAALEVGHSYGDVGLALGITRQSAHERYRSRRS